MDIESFLEFSKGVKIEGVLIGQSKVYALLILYNKNIPEFIEEID